MARWAALVRDRAGERPVALLDGGNFAFGRKTNFQETKERYLFRGMDLMDYDAVGVGGNEIALGRARLFETAGRHDIPLTTANIIDRRGDGTLAEPFRVLEVGGRWSILGRRDAVRIGVFSIAMQTEIYDVDERVPDLYTVTRPEIAALEAVSALRERGCHVIIAMSRLGWMRSRQFAREVPGIDIVINSPRSHNGSHMERIGNTFVVDTGIHRASFTEIVLTFAGDSLRAKAVDQGRVLLDYEGYEPLRELEKDFEDEMRSLGATGY